MTRVFIFDPGTGATFNVNATGLIALAALREGVDPADTAEIAARVRARFPSAPPDIDEHVSDFVRTLQPDGAGRRGGRDAIVTARPLTIGVTGLNATDNPGRACRCCALCATARARGSDASA